MGLYDEQVVESFHQQVKKQLRILAGLPKDKLLDTLFFRLHNIYGKSEWSKRQIEVLSF